MDKFIKLFFQNRKFLALIIGGGMVFILTLETQAVELPGQYLPPKGIINNYQPFKTSFTEDAAVKGEEVFLTGDTSGAARQLEIDYPQFAPTLVTAPSTVETPIDQYVLYIYYFFIIICGLLALGALIYGGVRWMTSAGDPTALNDAREQMLAAFLGMIILLGSWLIIHTINPQFLVLGEPVLVSGVPRLAGGVWLCKSEKLNEMRMLWDIADDFERLRADLYEVATKEEEANILAELENLSDQGYELLVEIMEECYLVSGSGPIRRDFDNKARYACLVPEKRGEFYINYFAIIFEDPDYKGDVDYLYSENIYTRPTGREILIDPPSSAIAAIVNPSPDPNWKVNVYEQVDFNKGFPEGEKYKMTFPEQCLAAPIDYLCLYGMFNPSPLSIEITPGSDWVAALTIDCTSQQGWIEQSDIFVFSDTNLLDNERITEEQCTGIWFWRQCITAPAAKCIFMISGNLY